MSQREEPACRPAEQPITACMTPAPHRTGWCLLSRDAEDCATRELPRVARIGLDHELCSGRHIGTVEQL